MDDNQPDSNDQNTNLSEQYQSILDKYASDLAVTPPEPVEENPQIPPAEIPPVEPPPSPPVLPPPIVEPKPEPVMDMPQIVDTPVISTPKSGGFFKILFYLSLLVFLGILGANIYTYFFVSSDLSSSNQPTLTPNPTETPASNFCELNDNKYEINQTFPAQDGCNTCTCQSDLTITCTSEICPTSGPTKKITPTPTLPADLVTYVKEEIATKNNTTPEKITIGQYKVSGNYAQIAVGGDSFSGYVLWLYKSSGAWKIINSGQELPYCAVLSQFKFPAEFECQP